MTETAPDTVANPPAANAPAPRRGWSWWNALLIVSLALNLLIGAAAATRFFIPPPPDRMAGMSYLNLVPRKFMADLDRPRREELLGLLRTYRDRFRDGKQQSRKVAEGLADALDASPYDEAGVRAVLDDIKSNGAGLIGIGTEAALDFISRLSPEERNKLARRIRDRAEGGHHM